MSVIFRNSHGTHLLDHLAADGAGFPGSQMAVVAIGQVDTDFLSSLEAYDEGQLQKMIDLIYKYDCTKHVYIMTGNDTVLKQLKAMAPWLQLCCGGGAAPWQIVDRAIEIGCQKVQLFKPYFNQEMVDKAHSHGIRCNVFYADDPEEAKQYLDMGIDTILTNNYRVIAQAVKQYQK